jgi:hypothetical protein
MRSTKFLKPRPYKFNETIPGNVEECIKIMIKWDGAMNEFKNKNEADAVASTHHSVGKWIRNEWGLWIGSQLKDYFLKLGLKHPDDMSGVIIRSFHRHINGLPIDVENEIKRIRNHS